MQPRNSASNTRALARPWPWLLFTAFAQAQTPTTTPPDNTPSVIVTGNPLGTRAFEQVQAASALEAPELSRRAAPSLGETLRHLPGVNSTYFGPGSSRPIIRGLDGDRIRILQNGVGTLDASALSFDHQVAVEPMSIERVEVIRGPAALFYGGSAIGGVVNLIDARIPERPIARPQGAVDLRLGGDTRERASAGRVSVGNGLLAVHAEAFERASGDLKIPGFARSARQRATDEANDLANGTTTAQPRGLVPNSSALAQGGALGASLTFDRGYVGVSYSGQASNYGSPAERDVRIALNSDRWDFASAWNLNNAVIERVTLRSSRTDYNHREVSSGVVGTRFTNKGDETRLEAVHAAFGPLKGAIGVQWGSNRFSAVGDEAYVPVSKTQSQGVYLFEELQFKPVRFTLGLRQESNRIAADANPALTDASTGAARFPNDVSRSFNPRSAALGAFVPLGQFGVALNLTRNERAPTAAELFAYGPHVATGTYELGNNNFGLEKARGMDLALKWQAGPHSANLTAYRTQFDGFITGFATGQNRDNDGTINAAGELRELQFRQVPARFNGYEAQARFRLLTAPGSVFLELRADAVKATNRNTNEPLPRIPAARYGGALEYATERVSLKIETFNYRPQNAVPTGDTVTNGFTMVNAFASMRFTWGDTRFLGWLRASNLGNRDARLASSVLRETVPLGGRALTAGLRVDF